MPTCPTTALPTRVLDILHGRAWALTYSPPPYVDEKRFPASAGRPRSYSLLILDGPTGIDDWPDLQYAIRSLRCGFAMPCFVRFDPTEDATGHGLRAAVTAAGGELLRVTESVGQRARYVLTQRRDLASDWISWLHLRSELGWRQEAVIRALVGDSDGFRSSTEALEAPGIDARSARRWLNAAHLPAPSTWFCAGRILRALLRLQRDPSLSVEEIAVQLGYSSSDAFSNQMFRYFGHGAQKGRRLLGLESRFDAFEIPATARRS